MSTVSQAPRVAPEQGKKTRIEALDFTKGGLVLFMVLYHWLNYFVSDHGDFYRYLRFVTPSFIFITGFLISNVSFGKYGMADPRLPKRLAQRGLKLLCVFICLNLIVGYFFSNSYDGKIVFADMSAKNLISIYVTGNVVSGNSKAAAFTVLVPISYLLILSALFCYIGRVFKYIFHAACACFLLGVFAMYLNKTESANVELIAIGLLGVVCGYIPLEKINTVVMHPVALIATYLAYAAAITVWNVLYPLQVFGVCLCVAIIYMVGSLNWELGGLRRHVIRLGNYSLFGYIAQIAILQILHRVFRHMNLDAAAVLAITFVAGFLLTSIAVEITDRVRAKSVVVNGLYRVVFS